jgi:anti-sigma regulatory factor (Ser/Thr protein kinase)
MAPESSNGSVRGIEHGRRFEPVPQNVRVAREFVADALKHEGYSGDLDTVLLLVSELVTNAVRHAATPFEIVVDVHDDAVRVAVIDDDVAHPPEVRQPRPEDTNGRGLLIVDQLSAGWGSDEVDDRSKAVWFTFS